MNQTKWFGVLLGITRDESALLNALNIIQVQTNDTSNRLTHLNDVHLTHENKRSQTRNRDTLTQNRVVENNKLLIRISTKGTDKVEEVLTSDLLIIVEGTMLTGDPKQVITQSTNLRHEVCGCKHTHHNLCIGCCNQHLVHTIFIPQCI